MLGRPLLHPRALPCLPSLSFAILLSPLFFLLAFFIGARCFPVPKMAAFCFYGHREGASRRYIDENGRGGLVELPCRDLDEFLRRSSRLAGSGSSSFGVVWRRKTHHPTRPASGRIKQAGRVATIISPSTSFSSFFFSSCLQGFQKSSVFA